VKKGKIEKLLEGTGFELVIEEMGFELVEEKEEDTKDS